jgi:transcriptional regulator with XRE-family HTH domain
MEVEDELARVIDKIREVRTRKGLSQLELAGKADISQSFLASLESGKKQPSVMTILKLAKALEVNPGDLFPRTISSKSQVKEEILALLGEL